MELNFNLLQKNNPWWVDVKLIEQDEKIMEYSQQVVKYQPDFLRPGELEPGVYTILGPRQVGKSTAVKLFIRDLLLNKKITPQEVLFFQCDIIDDYKELLQILEIFLSNLNPNKHKYVFLDEISFVKDWPRAIKYLADRGELKKAVVILTGSLSLQIKGGAELLPGRRGKQDIQDFMFEPLDFRQYCLVQKVQVTELKLDQLLKEDPSQLVVNSAWNQIYNQRIILENLLADYLLTGGFLLALNEFKKDGKISDATFKIYWQWVRGDLLKLERNENVFLEIIQETIKHLGSTLSYNDVAKNISVSSHATVMDYLDLSVKFFLTKLYHNINLQKRLPALRKQKKMSFVDPFLFHLLNGQVLGGLEFFKTAQQELIKFRPALVEGMVMNFLRKHFLRAGFWREKKEVDFVGLTKDKTYGFEVKVRDKVPEREIMALKKLTQLDGLVVVSQSEFKVVEGVLVVPYWMVLLCG